MIPLVAFVGAGPTTIYTLNALLNHATQVFALTIFEEQATAGWGTPYRPGWNDPAMLSNIASIEIPPVTETLLEWMKRQPESRLVGVGVDPHHMDERMFYPRVALGQFLKDQFEALVQRARAKGIAVDVRTRCHVTDAVSRPGGIILSIQPENDEACKAQFDHLVLATGHQWPKDPEAHPGYFLSPWPASALARIPPTTVGVRGTSLTAIDAAVALAVNHGKFTEDGKGRLRYLPSASTEDFHLTMMSRKGVLPEADFFHPIPYEPLQICTPKAIDRLIATPSINLLDEAFALFKKELAAADPEYAGCVNLAATRISDFCDRYFADRLAADPFAWAEANLKEAEGNFEAKFTVPWRYAILRMHEVLEVIVPHLDDDDFERFTRSLKPIFVDDYATVPHESIKRMLALHSAAKLEIVALGEDYKVDACCEEGGATLYVRGKRAHFSAFVEAVGQRPLGSKDFPFPSLRKQGVVRDQSTADKPCRGIAVDDQFHLVAEDIPDDRLFCLSLPFLLGRHPFSQGITSSYEMGEVVGRELAEVIGRTGRAHLMSNPTLEQALS